MHSPVRFSSLVLAAAVLWAAVAGLFAMATTPDAASSTVRTMVGAFPTAEAGFAPGRGATAN